MAGGPLLRAAGRQVRKLVGELLPLVGLIVVASLALGGSLAQFSGKFVLSFTFGASTTTSRFPWSTLWRRDGVCFLALLALIVLVTDTIAVWHPANIVNIQGDAAPATSVIMDWDEVDDFGDTDWTDYFDHQDTWRMTQGMSRREYQELQFGSSNEQERQLEIQRSKQLELSLMQRFTECCDMLEEDALSFSNVQGNRGHPFTITPAGNMSIHHPHLRRMTVVTSLHAEHQLALRNGNAANPTVLISDKCACDAFERTLVSESIPWKSLYQSYATTLNKSSHSSDGSSDSRVSGESYLPIVEDVRSPHFILTPDARFTLALSQVVTEALNFIWLFELGKFDASPGIDKIVEVLTVVNALTNPTKRIQALVRSQARKCHERYQEYLQLEMNTDFSFMWGDQDECRAQECNLGLFCSRVSCSSETGRGFCHSCVIAYEAHVLVSNEMILMRFAKLLAWKSTVQPIYEAFAKWKGAALSCYNPESVGASLGCDHPACKDPAHSGWPKSLARPTTPTVSAFNRVEGNAWILEQAIRLGASVDTHRVNKKSTGTRKKKKRGGNRRKPSSARSLNTLGAEGC